MRATVAVCIALASIWTAGCRDGTDPGDDDPSNLAPTAVFTFECDKLACSFSNGSADSDGSIDAYDWDFGDGSAHVTTRHATHMYASPGDGFTVTLIVTDDDGETATTTEEVVVGRGVVVVGPFRGLLGQHVAPNSPVSVPPYVVLSDEEGLPLQDVPVDFEVTGGGSVSSPHVLTDENGRASCGQWIVGAANGADTVLARVDGVTRAIFYARAAFVRARYDLETVAGQPALTEGRLFFWSDLTVTRSYLHTGEIFDSTQITAVYQQNGDLLTWTDGACCLVTGTIQGDRLTVVEILEDDEVYLRSYGTLSSPEPLPLPEDPPPEPPAGVSGIYLADPDGENARLVVLGERPAWSPDGRRIAFQRDGRIHVGDGVTERELGAGTEPTWAPDGHRIAFRGYEGIAVMTDDGSGVTTILRRDFRDDTWAASGLGVGRPAWSPDGAWIAFEHLGDGDISPATIFLMRPDGSEVHRLTNRPGRREAQSDPSWSSDGREVLFWSFDYGVARVSAAGGTPRTIYLDFPAVAYGAKPAEAPAGGPTAGTVLLTANRYSDTPAIWAVRGPAESPVVVTGGKDAVWSPDGTKILFARVTAGR
jgi:Tol biopolymer transport system component